MGSDLVDLGALPLACRAGDFDGDRALLSLSAQRHAVGLQRAEGDLQLWFGEAPGPAVLSGDLRGLQHRRIADGALWDSTWC